MRRRRHAVLCVPLPPGFVRSSPDQIPPEFLFIPRIALGEAAAVAAKLNADQIAAGDAERKLFLPMKCFEPLRRKPPAQEGDATSGAGPQASYADTPAAATPAASAATTSAPAVAESESRP